MISKAYNTLIESNADLIVANDVGKKDTGFEAPTNEVYIIDKKKNITHEPLQSKRMIAVKLIDTILESYREKEFERSNGE
jgi:phosphopantothenoylcysteine decarboxylase/phosphopantothenate--cysteine ligase